MDIRYAAVDEYLQRKLRRLQVPGAALAIVEKGEIVHVRGFGKARPGGETPTGQTPFWIGSLTKSITALAAMLGMVPIALRGRGGELEAPMAITVIGGLFVSTLLTLVVVPMAYLLLDDLEMRFFKKRKSRA